VPERSLRHSLKWAFALTWGQRGITLVFTILLAAILGPKSFGVVAMALVYIAFADLIQDQGITTAIVQREKLEREHLDSAFWINLGWCILLAAVGFALAGWWADVNDTPQLESVIQVLSVVLVLSGFVFIQQAYVQRELEFQKLALRANVAAFVGGFIGLGLAIGGAGVWSLVAQQIAIASTSTVLMWAISDWRPGFRISKRHAKDIFGFSASVFVANVGGFVNRRGDVLLMGLFFGPTVVGIYRLADRFVDAVLELTLRPIGLVSLAHFSRLQHDRDALRGTVSSCIRLVMLTAVPALLALAASSEYVLAVVGPEWEPGADAMTLLCVVGVVKGLVHFTGPLLFAVARPLARALMLWVIAAVNVVTIVLTGLALEAASEKEQLLGMSAVRALVSLLVVVPMNLVIINRLAGLRLRTLAPWAVAPVTAGLASIAAVEGLSATNVLDGVHPVLALIVAGGLAVVTAGAILFVLERRIRAEVNRLRRSIRRPPGVPPLAVGDSVALVDGIDGTFEDLDGAEPALTDRRVPRA
jgi:polysaccharide transporter, PST family